MLRLVFVNANSWIIINYNNYSLYQFYVYSLGVFKLLFLCCCLYFSSVVCFVSFLCFCSFIFVCLLILRAFIHVCLIFVFLLVFFVCFVLGLSHCFLVKVNLSQCLLFAGKNLLLVCQTSCFTCHGDLSWAQKQNKQEIN